MNGVEAIVCLDEVLLLSTMPTCKSNYIIKCIHCQVIGQHAVNRLQKFACKSIYEIKNVLEKIKTEILQNVIVICYCDN